MKPLNRPRITIPLQVIWLVLIFVGIASAIALPSCSLSSSRFSSSASPSSPISPSSTLPSQPPRSHPMSLSVTAADSGKSLEVSSGDTLSLQLPENPTTGYRWAVQSPENQNLELQSSEFSPPSSGIGGSGQRVFTFRAKSSGTANLQLKEWREWEGDRSILNRFELTVRVK
ncbi:MAG TPA: protease inhibitor I42 family protein [Coleofasciculaceae cyanobacterium]